MHGRGATDNKSGVLAFQKAAKAFLQVRGEVPSNLKFLIEGEEEIGSPHVAAWAEANQTGFANPGANLHAPDENIHLDKYLRGIKYAAAIMEHFSRR